VADSYASSRKSSSLWHAARVGETLRELVIFTTHLPSTASPREDFVGANRWCPYEVGEIEKCSF
jgi:hypothetical protein